MSKLRSVPALSLAAVIAVGFFVVWGFVIVCAGIIWQNATREHRSHEQVQVRSDGTPVIGRYDHMTHSYQYRTLDGREIDVPEQDWLSAASLKVREREPRLQQTRDLLTAVFRDERTPETYWYFLQRRENRRLGYFVGYYVGSRTLRGYISRSGFGRHPPTLAECFPLATDRIRNVFVGRDSFTPWGLAFTTVGTSAHQKLAFLRGPDRIFEIDLRRGSVEEMIVIPDLVSVAALETPEESLRLAVRTAHRVAVYDLDGKQLYAFALPEALAGRDFSFFDISGEIALVQFSDHDETAQSYSTHLVWLSPQGEVLRQERDVIRTKFHGEDRRGAVLAWTVIAPSLLIGTILPAVAMPLDDWASDTEVTYSAALGKSLRAAWPALLILAGVGVGCVVFYETRRKRFAQPRSFGWMVFLFLLGVPGVAGYLLHRRWPVREACPTCRQVTPRDREVCSACRSPFPQPEAKGIEVFA